MERIDRDRALFLGICALQDYVDQASKNPLRPTLQLRALLALLAAAGKGNEACYREFWNVVRRPLDDTAYSEAPQHYLRATHAGMQWIGIARDLGFPAVDVEFCQKVRDMVRKARAPSATGPSQNQPLMVQSRDV
jgi:hypothetical protein